MSSPSPIAYPSGRPMTLSAIALMVLCCMSWGFNQVAVKLVLPEIPPLLQATIRSFVALLVIVLIAWSRRVDLFKRDGTLKAGLAAGVLFGLEFVLVYRGLQLTTASRGVVFLYTAPFFVALGSYRLLGERLRPQQWAGLGLSFAGVALAIGVPQPTVDGAVLLGDLMLVGGGAMWAATTMVVKTSALSRTPTEKGLGYQVAVSIPILGAAAWLSGEQIPAMPGALSLALMAYQSVWVVGLTFLLWFALVKTYSASTLSSFTFVTPLFGISAGYLVLHEPLSTAFGAAAILVIAGLYLVNRPPRPRPRRGPPLDLAG